MSMDVRTKNLVLPLFIFGLLSFDVRAFVPISYSARTRDQYSSSLSVKALHAVSSTAIRPISEAPFVQETKHNQHRAHGDLENLGLPFGLRQVLLQSLDLYKKRIWILDNSGSMTMHDGHQILPQESSSCTRWSEVKETVNCHAMLAASIHAPTDFRLLNPPSEGGPQSFHVGYGRHAMRDCKRVQSCLSRNSPTGKTPLASSVASLRNEIVGMLPELQAENRKVAIVIATDGCNHDKNNVGTDIMEVERNQELLAALKSLQGLPVTVVVRLCTDYGPVQNFYNVLDESLSEGCFGIDVDVLDDHLAEADEVHAQNPWLNYALVLHRIREMGQDHVLFDLLDERPFTRAEIKEFCTLLFGVQDWPDDWMAFLQAVYAVQEMEKKQINPRTQALEPWIDVRQLFVIGCYWPN